MPLEKSFDAQEAEARIYAAWENAGAFKAGAGARREETFSIMIPPPNVTGALHVGHAFNNTIQDILTRWHRMRGFDTLWQPGQDHAGIATQLQVEKMLAETRNMRRRDMSREDFLAEVWKWKQQYGSTIINQLKRLGSSCDWSRNAFTMSGAEGAPEGEEGNFHDAVIKVFVKMYEDGLIYRGKRLVNWDPHFETAISDLEVENIENPGQMWHFKYPLAGGATYEYVEKDEDGNETLRETRDYISIATTRPETMLGDGAVAVHKDDERYAPIVGQLCEIPVGPYKQRRLIPIITDPYPDPDFGSGAVKITGAHDFNDYEVAKRAGIPMYRLMDTRGALRDDGVPYAEAAEIALAVARGERTLSEAEADGINLVPDDLRGLDRFEARQKVIDQITEEGNAVMIQNPAWTPESLIDDTLETPKIIPMIDHKPIMQPFGDRSGVIIEPMLTDQWFVDTDKIVGPALDAVRNGDTKIMPESGEKVYFHWLENIEPWCISRQLWWGHQVPVWYGLDLAVEGGFHDDHDNALDEVELFALLGEGLVHAGERHHAAPTYGEVVPLFKDDEAPLPQPLNHARVVEVEDRNAAVDTFVASLADYNVSQDPTHLVYPVWRDPDVLDTWFSSGLWPIGTLGWPNWDESTSKYFPTSTLVTGQDILFFWVARMMMMQLSVVEKIPFETVYLHQLVRDEKGKKMSKTAGNVIDPLVIIDEYGADALRFTNTAMAAIGGVLKLSEDRIKGYRNFGTKLWNACRFAEMNDVYNDVQNGSGGAVNLPQNVQNASNAWIIGEVGRTREAVDKALSAYRFNDAASTLYAFVWGTVCDWYVELSKPLFFSEDQAAIAETRATMAWVLDQCMILLHPIMPFITEELWGNLTDRKNMLVLEEWPTYQASDLIDDKSDSEMSWVIALIEEIRSIRGEMGVPAGAKIPVLVQELDDESRSFLTANQNVIERLARIESFSNAPAPKGAVTVTVRGGSMALPLADIIDIESEKARLEKSAQKLAKEMGGLSGRLNNAKFIASAPDEVVEETRMNLHLRSEEAAKVSSALQRLEDME